MYLRTATLLPADGESKRHWRAEIDLLMNLYVRNRHKE